MPCPVRLKIIYMAVLAAAAVCLCASAVGAAGKFTPVAKGVEYGVFSSGPDGTAESKVHIVRINPGQAKLGVILASEHKVANRTVSDWCKDYGMVAAINAGMYLTDYKTNVGYLRNGNYVQNKKWNKKYLSVLAFNPKVPGIAPAVLMDIDTQDPGHILDKLNNYDAVVQNLRLMKGNAVNVWSKSDKKWSESAIGIDQQGRILFIFCRYPYTMWQFVEIIKSFNIGVTRMMHVEGGPIASMSVRTAGTNVDLAGGYESNSTFEGNGSQFAVPNVIGVFEQ